MLQKAVELDPNFAMAYVFLSNIHSWLYFNGMDQTPERLAKSKAAVDEALRLQPELPKAPSALGYYYYRGFRDYERALELFERVRKSRPNYSPQLMGYIQRRQGKFEESTKTLKEAFRLNPRSFNVANQITFNFKALRQYQEADNWYNRALSINQQDHSSRMDKAWNYVLWKRDTESARAIAQTLPHIGWSDYFWFTLNRAERNYPETLERLLDMSSNAIEIYRYYAPKNLALALVYYLKQNPSLMKVHADSAYRILKTEVQERSEDPRRHIALGFAHAFLGRTNEAIQSGKRAVELLPVSKDALSGPYYVLHLAEIYVVVGEYDAAIETLEYLLSIPVYDLSVAWLRLDPIWDPLRDKPRFQKLLEKHSRKAHERLRIPEP